jgi:hypothetical protein
MLILEGKSPRKGLGGGGGSTKAPLSPTSATKAATDNYNEDIPVRMEPDSESELSIAIKKEFGDSITNDCVAQGLAAKVQSCFILPYYASSDDLKFLLQRQMDEEFEMALHSLQYADESGFNTMAPNPEGDNAGQAPPHPSLTEHRHHLHAINKLSNLKMLTVPFYALRADNLKNMELRAEGLDISTTVGLQRRIRALEDKANVEWTRIGNQTMACSAAEFEFSRQYDDGSPDSSRRSHYDDNLVADEVDVSASQPLSSSVSTSRLIQPRTGGLSSSFAGSKSMENLPRLDRMDNLNSIDLAKLAKKGTHLLCVVRGSKVNLSLLSTLGKGRDLSGVGDSQFLADLDDASKFSGSRTLDLPTGSNSPMNSGSRKMSQRHGPEPTTQPITAQQYQQHSHIEVSPKSSSSLMVDDEHAHHYAAVSSDKDFPYALSRNQFKSKEFDPPPNRLGFGGKRLYPDSHETHIGSTHRLTGRYPDIGVSVDECYQTMNSEYFTDVRC